VLCGLMFSVSRFAPSNRPYPLPPTFFSWEGPLAGLQRMPARSHRWLGRCFQHRVQFGRRTRSVSRESFCGTGVRTWLKLRFEEERFLAQQLALAADEGVLGSVFSGLFNLQRALEFPGSHEVTEAQWVLRIHENSQGARLCCARCCWSTEF
jgi:hypothetical protein